MKYPKPIYTVMPLDGTYTTFLCTPKDIHKQPILLSFSLDNDKPTVVDEIEFRKSILPIFVALNKNAFWPIPHRIYTHPFDRHCHDLILTFRTGRYEETPIRFSIDKL